MLRLPEFTYHRPATAVDAVALTVEHGKDAMYVAGGTDLYPNMKRRHQEPTHVVSLQDIPELHGGCGVLCLTLDRLHCIFVVSCRLHARGLS